MDRRRQRRSCCGKQADGALLFHQAEQSKNPLVKQIPICRTVKAAADRIVGGCAILCRDHSVVMRCAKSMIPCRNTSNGVNVVCEGSPSRLGQVRRVCLGITIRPRSSIRRTIPVAFIYTFLLKLQIVLIVSVIVGEIYCRIYYFK